MDYLARVIWGEDKAGVTNEVAPKGGWRHNNHVTYI